MLTIRVAIVEDVPTIRELHINTIKEICSSHYTSEEIKIWTERQKKENYQRNVQHEVVLVAEKMSKIVGFGHLGEPNEDTDCEYEIKALYVASNEIRTGVGSLLLKELENEAFKRGACTNMLVYSSKNAVEFYKKLGFVEKESVLKCGGPCHSLNCIKMIKSYK